MGPDILEGQTIGQWSGTQQLCETLARGCCTYATLKGTTACIHTLRHRAQIILPLTLIFA